MRVTGPAWPSTAALRTALAEVQSDRTLAWGAGGKDGLQQLEAFKTAGVLCPTFTASLEEAKQWVRDGVKVWGRSRHHTQGKDIVEAGYTPATVVDGTIMRSVTTQEMRWITTRRGARVQRMRPVTHQVATPTTRRVGEKWSSKWERSDFWVQVIPGVVNEYRQHVFNGQAIRRGMKKGGGEVTASRVVEGVRSRRNGWTIDYGPFTAPTSLRESAKAAVAACGYTWGAVDVVATADGRVWMLEVNSAPALKDEATLKAYVDAIKRWVAAPTTNGRRS